MKISENTPEIGPSARTLGARADIDILVVDDVVRPRTGGISVAPDDPKKLPRFRRPADIGGTGRDPVFFIDERDLGPDLVYRADPDNPSEHGFIEPARMMRFEEFQQALFATRHLWRPYKV